MFNGRVISYDLVCPSVGQSVCNNFLKGREVTLPCSYRNALEENIK